MFLINTNKIIIKIASLFSFLSLKAISGSINMTFPCFLHTAQKMKFSIKDFFSKCDQIQVTFTEEILNGKLHLCEVQ